MWQSSSRGLYKTVFTGLVFPDFEWSSTLHYSSIKTLTKEKKTCGNCLFSSFFFLLFWKERSDGNTFFSTGRAPWAALHHIWPLWRALHHNLLTTGHPRRRAIIVIIAINTLILSDDIRFSWTQPNIWLFHYPQRDSPQWARWLLSVRCWWWTGRGNIHLAVWVDWLPFKEVTGRH